MAAARPLAELLASAADLLGVREYLGRGAWLSAAAPDARHVVVVLIDGLGALQLSDHQALVPTLASLPEAGPLAAPFPATTSTSLASLGTGLPPGMHGVVGSAFLLDDGTVLTPLSWGSDPNPIATQPEPTVLERCEAAGVRVTSIGPASHRTSGLTRAALRGGSYLGADSAQQRIDAVASVLARSRSGERRTLTYVYWPDLDKAGHVHGVDSVAYRVELARVDGLVTGLATCVSGDVALLVTADHGLVDVPDERRIDLERNPRLRDGVRRILGEPRARHVYSQPGRAQDVATTWRRSLGDRATVLLREQAAELMGPVDPWYADRVGDVVAIAEQDWALVSDRVDRVVSGLRGQHGGRTPAEVLVPARLTAG